MPTSNLYAYVLEFLVCKGTFQPKTKQNKTKQNRTNEKKKKTKQTMTINTPTQSKTYIYNNILPAKYSRAMVAQNLWK